MIGNTAGILAAQKILLVLKIMRTPSIITLQSSG